MVNLILALNAIVFLLWLTPSEELLSFMATNFLVSWDALAEGRIWVLITSVFSHSMFLHFLINMFVLRGFGSALELALGSRAFLGFYLVAGVVSSFAHAAFSLFFLNDPGLPALGASGSIAGVVMTFALMFPRERILLLGLIPIPALWGVAALVGFDVWGLLKQAQGGGLPIGHGAHLGGALTGLVFYFAIIRRQGWMKRRMMFFR